MRLFTTLYVLFSTTTIIISSVHATQRKRHESPGLLINPPGFFPLPAPQGPSPRPEPLISPRPQLDQFTLNLSNIQGDILVGMRKKVELFYFFGIQSPEIFKTILAADIYPLITNTQQILESPLSAVNIAFSNSGLELLGVTNLTTPDDPFITGQASDAFNLGDPSPIQNNWIPGFVNTAALHGVFLIGGQNTSIVDDVLDQITSYLGDSIIEIYSLQASARPGDEEGHEHFGYLDGISQPGILGFTTDPVNGQVVIPPGIILLGEEGDPIVRPGWAQDGSFLAFRQLQQLVPEFNTFLTNNALMIPGITTLEEGRELLGARMMGRWKSGAPIELSPLSDNLTLAADPNLNNNFNYTLADDNSLCPFASHLRKSYPRSDLDETTVDDLHRIMRASTPYGPEVAEDEIVSNATIFNRGLAFVAYQSNIAAGFRFLQQLWCDNPGFLGHPNFPLPGYDPIIGANFGQSRFTQGLDPTNQTNNLILVDDFIISRGGEYFFSPSLSAIINVIAAPVASP